jgi:hypothetical protein
MPLHVIRISLFCLRSIEVVDDLTVPVQLLDCVLSGGKGIPLRTHHLDHNHARTLSKLRYNGGQHYVSQAYKIYESY